MNKVVIGTVVAAAALTPAPTAAAAETITVQEVCSYYGGQPYMKLGAGMVCQSGPGIFLVGNPIRNAVTVKWPDAYPVDAANPWSDWVLPGGRASAKPPTPGYLP